MTARLRGLADNRRPGSLADRFRQRRFELLRGLVDALPRPVRILDVGGTRVVIDAARRTDATPAAIAGLESISDSIDIAP